MLFKKFLSLLLFVVVAFTTLHAAPISTNVAEGNALKWMKSKNHQAYTIKKEIPVKSNTSNRAKKRSAPKYKILELEPKGWVIVSLDDVIEPIIGYGDSKIDAENIPPALTEYLEDIESKIEYLNRYPKSLNRKSRKEMLYAASDNTYIVQPLLWLGGTSEDDGLHWGQGKTQPCPSGYTCSENVFYNAQTPEWEPGNHTYTGCVATAMGQIMRYWKYPSVGRGQHCYTPQTHPEYGEQCVDFGSTTYDWDSMPLTLTSANYNVAQILYHAGVAVDMDYTNSGSGAYFRKQMQTYFSYKMMIEFDRGIDINTSVKEFLNINIPIIASGRNNSSGHLYIIDGYDGDGYYHFNWGWNGMSNGKYTLDNGTWGYVSNRFAAVAPSDPSPQVAIADSHFSDCIVEDLSLEDSSEIKELSLKYASSLNCTDKNITNMDGIEYFVNISSLYLSDNNLTSLNLNTATKLKYVSISNNNLTSLNLSSANNLVSLSLSSNSLSSLMLPVGNRYSYIDLSYNPINILEIDNLKNIDQLRAYGTDTLYCWQKNALASENNITTIDMNCNASSGDALDTDGDGIANIDDPDDDNDGVNDLLDDDIDGDGVLNDDDAFPLDATKSSYYDEIPEAVTEVNTTQNLIDKVLITWSPVNGATYYKVLRYDSWSLDSNYIEFTTNNNDAFYDDVPNDYSVHTYRIKACNTQGCSGVSTWEAGQGQRKFLINASDGTYDDKVTISYPTFPSFVKKFNLFRAVEGDNSYEYISSIYSNNQEVLVDTTALRNVKYNYIAYLYDEQDNYIGNSGDIGYLAWDTDNDGVSDINDAFPNNANESIDTDNDGIGNNADMDDDNDGISDTVETANGLNPLDASDAEADLDDDGFSNVVEISIGTDIHDANSKPVWAPVIMGDIITFVLVKS